MMLEDQSKHLSYIARRWPYLPLYLRAELYYRVKFYNLDQARQDFFLRYGWAVAVILWLALVAFLLTH